MERLRSVLRRLDEKFEAFRSKPADKHGSSLTAGQRADLDQQVEDMIVVAEVQRTAGHLVLMRELEKRERELMDELLAMEVHRFSGKRGIEVRGRILELKRRQDAAQKIVERGATAQQMLLADERLHEDPATLMRV